MINNQGIAPEFLLRWDKPLLNITSRSEKIVKVEKHDGTPLIHGIKEYEDYEKEITGKDTFTEYTVEELHLFKSKFILNMDYSLFIYPLYVIANNRMLHPVNIISYGEKK